MISKGGDNDSNSVALLSPHPPLTPPFTDTEWVAANTDLCEKQSFVVRGLPVGEKINFRVVAVNIAGRSPPAVMSQPVTIREVMGESSFGPVKTRICEHITAHLRVGSTPVHRSLKTNHCKVCFVFVFWTEQVASILICSVML